jgi:hypothetical protein
MVKLIINFGHQGIRKEVNWYRDFMDFPKLLKFQGVGWEWVVYTTVGDDYELTFSKIPTYDPNYYASMESYEEMFEWGGDKDKCCCGSIYTSFSFDHMRYCPKWTKW